MTWLSSPPHRLSLRLPIGPPSAIKQIDGGRSSIQCGNCAAGNPIPSSAPVCASPIIKYTCTDTYNVVRLHELEKSNCISVFFLPPSWPFLSARQVGILIIHLCSLGIVFRRNSFRTSSSVLPLHRFTNDRRLHARNSAPRNCNCNCTRQRDKACCELWEGARMQTVLVSFVSPL